MVVRLAELAYWSCDHGSSRWASRTHTHVKHGKALGRGVFTPVQPDAGVSPAWNPVVFQNLAYTQNIATGIFCVFVICLFLNLSMR